MIDYCKKRATSCPGPELSADGASSGAITLVLVFVIAATYASSAAALDARSEAAPPAPEGLAGLPESAVHQNINTGNMIIEYPQEPSRRCHRHFEFEYLVRLGCLFLHLRSAGDRGKFHDP
jgi:hypothetical protein